MAKVILGYGGWEKGMRYRVELRDDGTAWAIIESHNWDEDEEQIAPTFAAVNEYVDITSEGRAALAALEPANG